MYSRVPDDFIAKLLERVDIVDVVAEHVRLTRSGRSFTGLCPLHSEKTPSFHVTPGKGYHCFGCGAGGSAINFLMEVEQLTFREAVERLASRVGLQVPSMEEEAGSDPHAQRRTQLLHVHDLAAKLYNHIVMNLDAGTQGLSYFLHRGLTKKIIAQYSLGFAPKSGNVLVRFLEKRGIARDLLTESGLCVQNDRGELFDRFRGRVMFPIWDLQGRVIAFGGRTLGSDQPKYLNSPETPLFSKGRTLYGYHKARQAIRQAGKVLLLEGYMDVLALHQAGFQNAVAGLGTALTPEQAGLLNRVAETVVLLYDGDTAGQSAASKSLAICREAGANVRIAMLPEGVDPDEWIQSKGVHSFRTEILDKASSGLAFELTRLTKLHPNHLTSDRIAYLNEAVVLIARESSAIEREDALERLAKQYGISASALRDDVQKSLAAQKRTSKDKTVNVWNTDSDSSKRGRRTVSPGPLPEKEHVAARQLLTFMMMDVSVFWQVTERFAGEFPGPLASALQAYMYKFYEEHGEADPQFFISCIDDSQVVHFAAELLHKADDYSLSEAVRQKMIDDSITCLIRYASEQEERSLEEHFKAAVAASDYVLLGKLDSELRRLRERPERLFGNEMTAEKWRERGSGR